MTTKIAVETEAPHGAGRSSLRQYGLRVLVVLFILNAVDEFDRAVLAVSLDDIREQFNLNDATVALLPLAVVFITGILSVPAGALADRWSRRNILVLGAIVWGSAGLLAAVSRSFVQLFLTRALLGVGQGTIGPTHLSLLSDHYPVSVRGRVMNYWRAANPFGQVIGAVIGGAIVSTAGWRWAFAAAAILGLSFGLYALSLREPKRGEADHSAAIADNPLLGEFLREPETKRGFFESQGTIFRNRTLRYLIAANAAIGFVLFGIVYWIPTMFEREYGFSTPAASAAYGALAFAGFLGAWFGGPFADRRLARGFSHLTGLGGAALLVLFVSWTVAFAVPVAPLTVALLVGGAFFTSFGAAGLIPVMAAASPPRIRSQSFAAFGLSIAVFGGATAPLIIGAMSELFQSMGINEGAALRYSMLIATAIVSLLGSWLIYQAARTAGADVQRVFGEFIAEHTTTRALSDDDLDFPDGENSGLVRGSRA